MEDAGGSTERGRVAPDLGASGLECRHPRAELRHVALLRGVAAPDVRVLRREPLTLRPVDADHDRDPARPRALRLLGEATGCVPRSIEVGMALTEERDDDPECFLEAGKDLVLGQPEGVRLAPGMARPEPEHEPPTADLVERLDRLGGDASIAMEGRQDPRPDLDPRRHRRDRAGNRDAFPDSDLRFVLRAPEQLVCVPDDAWPLELANAVDHLGGLATGEREIATLKHAIYSTAFDVSYDGLERGHVAVNV